MNRQGGGAGGWLPCTAPVTTMPCGIPRVIWQTWKTKEVPEHWRPSPAALARHMPEWRHVLTTDAENRAFIAQFFPDYLRAYDAFPHTIQRVDVVRYAYLYVVGGLYVDLDIEVTASLEPLLQDLANPDGSTQVWMPRSPNFGHVLTNCLMAATPRAPMWLAAMAAAAQPPPLFALGKHLTVMTTSGAGMLHRTLGAPEFRRHIAVLPTHLVMPCGVCDGAACVGGAHALARALPGGGSWTGGDTAAINGVLCRAEAWVARSDASPLVVAATATAAVLLVVLLVAVAAWVTVHALGYAVARAHASRPLPTDCAHGCVLGAGTTVQS